MSLEVEFGADRASVTWFAEDAGRAILEGRDLTAAPTLLRRRHSGWKRMKERVGLSVSTAGA